MNKRNYSRSTPSLRQYHIDARSPQLSRDAFQGSVKADIEADVKKGILERVPAGEHDTWCSRMVIQPKKSGKARRTVDLSYLSKHGFDESHHTPSGPVIAKHVPSHKYKSTLDCVDGQAQDHLHH